MSLAIYRTNASVQNTSPIQHYRGLLNKKGTEASAAIVEKDGL